MWKKFAVVGSVVAVAGLGAGGVATAFSGTSAAQAATPAAIAASVTSALAAVPPAIGAVDAAATSGNPTTGKPAAKNGKQKHRAGLAQRLSRASHATWVTKDNKTGTFVTHDAVRGAVAAVAAGSVTIKATDGTTETFVVTGSTKVRVNGTTGGIGQVKVGDRVAVLGTGSAPMTATRVVDRGTPGTKHAGRKQSGKATPTTPPTGPQSTSSASPTPTAPTS